MRALPALGQMLAGTGIHLLDGAMGTVLYDRGIFLNVCYDDLSRTDPELVAAVHRAYVEAGAELVETNTFGANPVKLSAFGLDAETEAINRAGARVARSAAGSRARVLGAMGPLGIRIEPWGPTGADEAREFFGRQVDGLLGTDGVDGFILETFQDPSELRQALEAIRARCDLPVLAQVTLAEGGHTAYGADVETVVRDLEGWGVDAVGFNCSVGPAGILEAVERAAATTGLPILAQPNAGFPRTVGDRKMYLASPEYMARYARRIVEAGARFVGGCCGTTPEHVRCMGEALAESDPERGRRQSARRHAVEAGPPGGIAVASPAGFPAPALDQQPPRADPEPTASPTLPLRERSSLGAALESGAFVSLVELVPPRGWDPEALLARGRALRDAGVTAVTIPDAPRGLARMGSLPAATLLARDTGVEVLAHYACRDRNMIGMISDLLGAAASGIRNILLVTGDLSPTGPYPDHTTIFDIDSIGLTNVVRRLNEGHDPGGPPVEPPTRFVIGVTLNQGAVDREREDRRFRFKVEAGAEYAVTQPVFDAGTLLGFLDRHAAQTGLAAETGPAGQTGRAAPIPVIAGVWPLTSLGNAEFLANEVPGVVVPASVVERMRAAELRGPEAATEEGIRIAVENVEAVRHRVQGIHVAAPRGRIDLALEVLARAGVRGAPA
ncbi:bifunctional homocysteine S-methyltransferase/methylenetetrahydrofolate reductase [soil metagenome]